MHCPEKYVRENAMQRNNAEEVTNKFISKMTWRPKETILDIGCGPGDVTSDILYPILKNNIEQLVGVDLSRQMMEYANKTYGCSKIVFKVLNIEHVNDCTTNALRFNKIFSFFCFHWVCNKFDALNNMHFMLKNGGEILIHFLLINPVFELYKHLDAEWQPYVRDVTKITQHSKEELKDMFIKAGFRIVSIESSVKRTSYPDFSSILNAIKVVDNMYNVLPLHLHEIYFNHVKDILCKKKIVNICPTSGKTSSAYLPITIHAIKD